MVPSDKRPQYQVCHLTVSDHLAEFARRRFPSDERTGALIVPTTSDLWYCMWEEMRRRPRGVASVAPSDANLHLRLPFRRRDEGFSGKDPAYWNYIPPGGVRQVEACLRRRYYFEFHEWMLRRDLRDMLQRDRIRYWMSYWGTSFDHEDALLKNWQRWRKIKPRKHRFV